MKITEIISEDAAGVGVIANRKQANDPRYKTSLTVDVKPDTMKRAIAAYFPTKPLDSRQKQVRENSNNPVAVDSTSPINGDEGLDEETINEIERLSKSGFEGGKDYLDSYGREKSVQKLPGGSGLLYSITKDGGDFVIKLWDKDNKEPFKPTPVSTERPSFYSQREWAVRLGRIKDQDLARKKLYDRSPGKLIGQLTVNDVGGSFPLPGAVQVGTITVDEDYRGMGLAKALYGIVLTIMKRPLLAGSSQTPGGRRNWLSLSQIPGVEMKGYFKVDDYDIKTMDPKDSPSWERGQVPRHNKAAEKTIDTIMGELGGQYIGKNRWGNHYFAFDVRPNTTKQELQAYVNTKLSQVYGGYYSSGGLFAVWTGK